MVQRYDNLASRIFQTLMRVLQFGSSVISLVLVSISLSKIHKSEHRVSASTGAVEGILAAAVLYSLAATLINCLLRRRTAPQLLCWLLMAFDFAFMGAFVGVAALTRLNGKLISTAAK